MPITVRSLTFASKRIFLSACSKNNEQMDLRRVKAFIKLSKQKVLGLRKMSYGGVVVGTCRLEQENSIESMFN